MKTQLIEKILQGDVRAAGRLMRDIEDETPDAIEELKSIYPYTGRAHIIGVTGPPGVGKSTLIDALITSFRRESMTVGVIAIDPTSIFTGGALLGDRVRMQKHSTDQGVFIRSLAARGWTGGLSKATTSMIHVMDAMNKDIILVETVGAGQAEIDILRIADTTILVLTPGMGDAIQMMKAGILEGSDIFVINKAGKDGAENLKMELQVMLEVKGKLRGEWEPGIILAEAVYGKGIEELVREILRHREFLTSSGELEKCRRERAKLELTTAIEVSLKSYINNRIDKHCLEKLLNDLVQKKTNPYSAALGIINRSIKLD